MREKKLSIRLGDKLHAELVKKAEKYNQSISEYVRGVLINKIIQRRIEKMEKEYIKQIWVCVSPDNGHWNEKFVHEEVERIAKKWDVKAVSTAQTRDRGYGQERLFAVSGESENIEGFELELDEALY